MEGSRIISFLFHCFSFAYYHNPLGWQSVRIDLMLVLFIISPFCNNPKSFSNSLIFAGCVSREMIFLKPNLRASFARRSKYGVFSDFSKQTYFSDKNSILRDFLLVSELAIENCQTQNQTLASLIRQNHQRHLKKHHKKPKANWRVSVRLPTKPEFVAKSTPLAPHPTWHS
jgi:hypothetical protein